MYYINRTFRWYLNQISLLNRLITIFGRKCTLVHSPLTSCYCCSRCKPHTCRIVGRSLVRQRRAASNLYRFHDDFYISCRIRVKKYLKNAECMKITKLWKMIWSRFYFMLMLALIWMFDNYHIFHEVCKEYLYILG